MINYYNSSQIKAMDRAQLEKLKSNMILIERAGKKAAEVILASYDPKRVAVFCGKGNNGRDGLICACTLSCHTVECYIVTVGCDIDEYQKIIHERCQNVKFFDVNDLSNLPECDLMVDAILGIGQNREISGDILTAVDYINSSNAIKVAIDVPTGVNCDSGEILPRGVKCQTTISFTANKPGIALFPAKEYVGKEILLDIGIPKEGHLPVGHSLTCANALGQRSQRSHKGSYGKVVCFTGGEGMPGAAYFSAMAAYLSGAGLVNIITHKNNKTTLSTLVPEAVITCYDDWDSAENIVLDAITGGSSILVGCGMGKSTLSRKIVREIAARSQLPTVYDADALNIIAEEGIKPALPSCAVYTPHMMEFSRLTKTPVNKILASPLNNCREYAMTNKLTCLLKDANTVISSPDGKFYINTNGNNGMATAGSGDVLAGIIAGLLASSHNNDVSLVTATAAFIHGKAGDLASNQVGTYSLMARDILRFIPNAITSSI